MQRASQPAEEREDAIEAIAALTRQAHVAYSKVRVHSAVEYLERALALANATQPGESLVVASTLNAFFPVLVKSHDDALMSGEPAAWQAAWQSDPRAVAMARRSLELLLSRYEAGSLSHLTPDEAAFFKRVRQTDALTTDAEMWLGGSALLFAASWAVSGSPSNENFRLSFEARSGNPVLGLLIRAVLAVLRLVMQQRYTERGVMVGEHEVEVQTDFRLTKDEFISFGTVIEAGLNSFYLPLLRSHGLTYAEEQKMSRMLAAVNSRRVESNKAVLSDNAAREERAAADLARHGLRRCTLPDCGAEEPHPKAFKLCGRCKSTAYCCPEHAAQDWRRHKRAECSRPAAAE